MLKMEKTDFLKRVLFVQKLCLVGFNMVCISQPVVPVNFSDELSDANNE